jgi:DNA-binding MarR family transcriptional regulator
MTAEAGREPASSAVSHPDPRRTNSRAAGVAVVADTFVSLMRAFSKARTRVWQNAQGDVERAGQVLLRSLGAEGPMRVSALADTVHSDTSTVSRQVASLVRDGLLERQADQADGRACLLVPTEAGRAVIARHDQVRMAFFDRMLENWNAEDLDEFARLLSRFAHDYERATSTPPATG